MNKTNKLIAYCGLLCAATLVLSFFGFTIPATICYVHCGVAMVMVAAYLLPKHYAALCVAVGMALCDLFTGYSMWMPFTFVIRFAQVYVIALFFEKKTTASYALGIILGTIIDTAGYYFAGALLYASFITPIASLLPEIVLNLFGIVLGGAICKILSRAGIKAEV